MSSIKINKSNSILGILIAILIISSWTISLIYLLIYQAFDWYNWKSYAFIALQTHLFTGLFITAHDSMHAAICRNKIINKILGQICTMLFVFNHYGNLIKKHHEHHRFVATHKDPDYADTNFFMWYWKFITEYVTISQIVLAAIFFNILIYFAPEKNVLAYWAIPSILSTLQLFYFGTYTPHKGTHKATNIHKSRSLRKNHLLAFLTCYFFGYHYEHHDSPSTPWWLLWKVKEANDSF